MQLKESGILLRIEIQNPGSTDKDRNQVPGIFFEILCLPKTKKGAGKRFCFKWPDTGQHTVLLDHHPPVS